MSRNKAIAAKTIPPQKILNPDYAPQEPRPPRSERKHVVSMSDRIAGTNLLVRNFKFKDAAVHFPNHPLRRTVDKAYPQAVGGLLLVDEPATPGEEQVCEIKRAVLKGLGYRYVVIPKDMDEYDVRKQLDEAA